MCTDCALRAKNEEAVRRSREEAIMVCGGTLVKRGLPTYLYINLTTHL